MNSNITPQLAGTWNLVSFSAQDPSGRTSYPFGKQAQGRLIYEANGRMSVQLMNPDRPRFASDDLLRTSEAEVRAAFDGYAAYYGSYAVNQGEKIMVHHVEAAHIPNWVGTDQVRHFELQGNRLTLKGDLERGGQSVVSLVWERLP